MDRRLRLRVISGLEFNLNVGFYFELSGFYLMFYPVQGFTRFHEFVSITLKTLYGNIGFPIFEIAFLKIVGF
jgi:hypothetical protein